MKVYEEIIATVFLCKAKVIKEMIQALAKYVQTQT